MLESMRRVLLVTNDFPPTIGGIQSYLRDYVATLPPDRVTVLTSTQDKAAARAYDAQLDYPVHRMPQRVLLPTPQVAAAMARLIQAADITAVWFGAAAPLGLLAGAARRAGAQTILASTHGHEVGWSMLPGARQMLRRIGNGCTHVSYISDYTYGRLRGAFGPHPTYVSLPSGVDADAFGLGEAYRRPPQLAGIPPAAPIVLCLSRLVPRKGQDSLLKVWNSVLAQIPETYLVIVGEGSYEPALRRLATQTRQVRFVGRVDDSTAKALFAAADIFAMPARTRGGGLDVEGLGIVYLEAQAAGLPVLAGDSGGAPETITRDSGVVVPGGDLSALSSALIALLEAPLRCEQMGQAGIAHVQQHWNWDALGASLAATLQ